LNNQALSDQAFSYQAGEDDTHHSLITRY